MDKKTSEDHSRNDEVEETDSEATTLETMKSVLGEAIEMIRTESRDEAVEAVTEFARNLEGRRSHKPPVPPKSDEKRDRSKRVGDEAEYNRGFRVLGDARDGLYRRMEVGRSPIEVEELRAARDPKMDALTQEWCKAVHIRNIAGRIALYDEMNDLFIDRMGYSRAALLEGVPNADSGFAAGTGGELLPLPLSNQLIVERDKASKMRMLVNVFPMSTQTVRIPVLPTVAATSRTENDSYADNTPNPDSALLSAKDIGVEFSAGRNFLEDTAFNMANQLTRVAGSAIGAEEDIQICTSTANLGDITEGLDAATITDVQETTVTTIGWEDIVAIYYALPEQYRRNAKFFAASTTMSDIVQIADGNTRPIFVSQMEAPRAINDIDPDAVGLLLGKPVYEVPVADDVIYFGDPQWYALGQRSGIRVDADRAVSTGLTTWVIDERIDGRVIPTSAVGTNDAWRKIIY